MKRVSRIPGNPSLRLRKSWLRICCSLRVSPAPLSLHSSPCSSRVAPRIPSRSRSHCKPRRRALVRENRFAGLERWKFLEVVHFLPVLIYFSLSPFSCGLSMFLFDIEAACGFVVAAIFALGVLFMRPRPLSPLCVTLHHSMDRRLACFPHRRTFSALMGSYLDSSLLYLTSSSQPWDRPFACLLQSQLKYRATARSLQCSSPRGHPYDEAHPKTSNLYCHIPWVYYITGYQTGRDVCGDSNSLVLRLPPSPLSFSSDQRVHALHVDPVFRCVWYS